MTLQSARFAVLDASEPKAGGRYVLYLLQQSQRADWNPALEFAIEEANRLECPLVVCFGLLDGSNGFPEANARHYAFMLQGLSETSRRLSERGIPFVVRKGSPAEIACALARHAKELVLDRGYLSVQRHWYDIIRREAGCRIVQVEGDVVVPIETASGKHEYAARTLRPKLHRLWDDYLVPLEARKVAHKAAGLEIASEIDLSDPDAVLVGLNLDRSVAPVKRFKGGRRQALHRLKAYLAGPFEGYGADRNKPEADAASHMSPYLHFGQISPVEIALAVREAAKGSREDRRVYLEELIVRRELAMNHVFHCDGYESYETALPEWAKKTLAAHAGDPRPYLYSEEQLAAGQTHEPYWNAAMREMRETGYMHNQLRMYWGKKILEWSPSPDIAFVRALRLNNRYFLDGRDANSFTNVGWIFGLHDRPWARRKIFGTVRYQSENSLKKFDAKAYLKSVERLCAAER